MDEKIQCRSIDRVIKLAPAAGRPRRSTATARSNAAASMMPPKATIQVEWVPLVAGWPIPWSVAGGWGFVASVDALVSRAATGSGSGMTLASALSIAEVETASAPDVGVVGAALVEWIAMLLLAAARMFACVVISAGFATGVGGTGAGVGVAGGGFTVAMIVSATVGVAGVGVGEGVSAGGLVMMTFFGSGLGSGGADLVMRIDGARATGDETIWLVTLFAA